MLEVDIEQFWKDDALAHKENCFSKEAPQVALGIRMSDECVFAELGEEGEPWGHTPAERRLELNKRYNEKARQIVGIPLLSEEPPKPADSFLPGVRGLHDVFGGKYVLNNGTWWLEQCIFSPQELEKTLDKIDKLDLREFLFQSKWEAEKKRIFEKYGIKPPQARGVRGPVTFATSIYGIENLIYLLYDEPDLAARFSDTIAKVIIGIGHIMDEEAGYTKENAPTGFGFNDDNCCMLSADLYQQFGYPVLKKVFAEFSPAPHDYRFQHSDSAMGHLLPLLKDFNLTGCNFGPTITVSEIRKHMSKTRIDGQLAPFTFMNNDEAAIIAEVKRDCEMAKENDLRGLNLSTAGSINNGSLLTSMRTVMHAIQKYGRY